MIVQRMNLILFIVVFLSSSFAFASKDNELGLTNEERLWVTANPNIIVGNEMDWPPFDYAEDGAAKGYSIDLMRLIAKKAGFNVEFVNGHTWQQLMYKFKAGEIHVLPAIYVNEERKEFIAFTKGYYLQPSVIVVNKNSEYIGDLSKLSGKKVAGVGGFAITKALKDNNPKIEIVPVSSTVEGIKAVSMGTADAFVESIGFVSHVIENNFVPNIKVITDADLKEVSNPSLHIGVLKENELLRDIIDKALASISSEEQKLLHDRWLASNLIDKNKILAKNELKLTKRQEEWLKQHPVIRLAPDISWPPFEWVDENYQYQGIASDYMRLIEQKLGVEFYIEKEKPWSEVVEDVKQRRLDVFPCVASNPQREKYLNFTEPYLSFPMVIITRDTSGYVDGTNALKDLRVGVVEGYATHEYFQSDHPEIRIRTTKSSLEGLKAVSEGRIDAFVGNLATTTYIIQNNGLANLKISGEMPIRYDLGVGVRKDWPIFAAIMQKALDSISDEQKKQIYNRWIGVRYEHGFDYSLFWKILGVFLLVLGFLYLYNRKLAEEISRRKFAEQELKNINKDLLEARDTAESANMAKTEFLSRMSHELRTPLTAIIGFAELFNKDDDLSKEHKKDASMIQNAGRHLLNIINDILDLSKIESDNIEIDIKDVNINDVVGECFNLIKPIADEQGVKIINTISSNESFIAAADYTRTKQVLLNLLSNGVKYNKQGGSVTIKSDKHHDKIRISIIDTGKGLIKQQIEKLFSPFDRAGAEDSQIKGTGIGLVISKRFVEMMGGSIGVESEPGKGSTFWVDLKLSKIESPEVTQQPPAQIEQPTEHDCAKKILYIEDMEPNIRLVSHILKKHTSHSLISASSAKLGIEMASAEKPDLILLDIGLPEMDGYEVLKHLHQNEQTHAIPVVALSANAMKEHIQKALDEGFKDYLTKPIDVKNLLSCINNVVS